MNGERAAAPPVRTVFFGSGAFAVPILLTIATLPEIELVGVVTAPDRPVGRRAVATPTPVALAARGLGVPLVQPARLRSSEGIGAVSDLHPDLGILADYGQLVPPAVLELPHLGILNVHPSLLPRHRGATPIPATIANADAEAGVTVIAMDAGLDTGPIVAQESWPLDGTETTPSLEEAAAARGAAMLADVLPGWIGGVLTPRPQGDEGMTLTRPFRREHGRLDVLRTAVELERLVRALTPWPGTFVETPVGRLAILRATVVPGGNDEAPGTVGRIDGRPALATADGRLVLEVVQRAGKRALDGRDFLRGQPGLVGTQVT